MRKVVDAANGLRERKKARTREAIIDAALDLFERNGYEATTVEDIAAAAEVSPRTFFRYFDSKLDLVMARRGEKHPDLGQALAARPAGEGLLEAVRAVLRTELEEQVGDPLVRREFQVMLTTPGLRRLAREHFHEEEADMVPAVAARLGCDPDDPAAHIATGMIASALWAAIDRWIAEGAGRERLDELLDQAFAALGEGLGGAAGAAAH